LKEVAGADPESIKCFNIDRNIAGSDERIEAQRDPSISHQLADSNSLPVRWGHVEFTRFIQLCFRVYYSKFTQQTDNLADEFMLVLLQNFGVQPEQIPTVKAQPEEPGGGLTIQDHPTEDVPTEDVPRKREPQPE
jgi:hypothetical protein